jgi:hypothetical protein
LAECGCARRGQSGPFWHFGRSHYQKILQKFKKHPLPPTQMMMTNKQSHAATENKRGETVSPSAFFFCRGH